MCHDHRPIFHPLADPTRQRIVEMLAAGALCAGERGPVRHEPARRLPASEDIETARAGEGPREAQRRIYELDPEGVGGISDWVTRLRAFWTPRLDALEQAYEKGRSHDRQGYIVEEAAVRFERDLPGPLEQGWAFLTDTARCSPNGMAMARSNRAKAAKSS